MKGVWFKGTQIMSKIWDSCISKSWNNNLTNLRGFRSGWLDFVDCLYFLHQDTSLLQQHLHSCRIWSQVIYLYIQSVTAEILGLGTRPDVLHSVTKTELWVDLSQLKKWYKYITMFSCNIETNKQTNKWKVILILRKL